MRNLYLILPFLFLSSPAIHAQEASGTSTVTFGVGGGWIASHPSGTGGGPAFNGTYEFRFSKYFAFASRYRHNHSKASAKVCCLTALSTCPAFRANTN